MIVYPNNVEIQEFVVKAQNKIADLCTLFVKRGANLPDVLNLLLELSDFIECLDDPYNTWLEVDVIERVHFYNHRANLNSLVYLTMTGMEVNVAVGAGAIGLPITTSDISNFTTSTNALIQATQHNSLSGIQPLINYPGYNASEKYHMNKTMYDYLYNLVYPYVAPTVGLSITSVPVNTGILAMGTSISSITLLGSYSLNSGVGLISYRYLKNGVVIPNTTVTPLPTDAILSYTDLTPSSLVDAVYTFEGTFTNGGVKTATQTARYRQPMSAGVYTRNEISATTVNPYQVTSYYVGDRQNMIITFTVPAGNTASTISFDASKAMYIFMPLSWGRPTSMLSVPTNYEFIDSWIFTEVNMLLASSTGPLVPGLLGIYNKQTEGVTTFSMKF